MHKYAKLNQNIPCGSRVIGAFSLTDHIRTDSHTDYSYNTHLRVVQFQKLIENMHELTSLSRAQQWVSFDKLYSNILIQIPTETRNGAVSYRTKFSTKAIMTNFNQLPRINIP